ncbi:MAG TPA: antitoxin VbhA family protein [Pseudonocardia sp.]|uniref:antitoxin VbhA family protein n=1 Tax=Pseudonocardia sp. TaxID=60912 RepID=UPI002D122E3A|nr:antitoxin VbhA family protein [Pseudonocardia sp.]HTF54140.1 antitoxin VbhA family protein [Pseudonocardia sp.]
MSHHEEPADAAERRDAVAEALASVRAEGLEPSAEGLALLEAVAAGALTDDQALEQLRRSYLR